ncbi:MAG: cobaltochelatase subunit CobN [Bacteroidales bacterium]|nr:cobaltochelatase subunit CobN [Bacteroidales bacterium]
MKKKKEKSKKPGFLRRHRRTVLAVIGAAVLVAALVWVWRSVFAPTRIAFVNYQATTLGQIVKSNNSSFIKIKEVSTDELKKLRHADMVMVNGMGLRLTAEQLQQLEDASAGVPTLTTAATNPQNYVISVDTATADSLIRYLNNGGRQNYRNMLLYIRRHIDGKRLFCDEPQAAISPKKWRLYHPNIDNPDAEEEGFASVAAYNDYLRHAGLMKDEAARVVLTGLMGEPGDLIRALEDSGMVVYPVRSMHAFVASGQIDSVAPSAVINMAHGRLGDWMTDWLKENNVPLFTTVYVPQLTKQWQDDRMGMNGGFMSQSIVTPEIDGAIRPFALFSHRVNREGIQEIYAEPSRLATFTSSLKRHIELQNKANSEKHVAIYYFKGPGQSALTASGMEVVPSLYNLLLRLKNNGYRVEGLPSNPEALGRLIQRQGAVLGTYAEGAFDDYMANGNPQLVSKEEYDQWSQAALPEQLRQEVQAAYGQFPGSYMATTDGQLAVGRVQLGNIVLLPQPMAGLGDNEFQIVHGTDQAPPYTYVASYLWARFGFGADAVIHFGTHGSLEYTPRKQVALCDMDWPDRLIGPLPHMYLYTTGNVGEALIAKRRSYAQIISHLTAPFMENGTRNDYRKLSEAIKTYYHQIEYGQPADKQALEVKRMAVGMGLHRALELDSNMNTGWNEDEINRVDNFAEELSEEKMTGRPYVLGETYERQNIESSVRSMCTDPIAYSLLALDKLRGKATADAEKRQSLFNKRYMEPSKQLVSKLLANPSLGTDGLVCQLAGITSEQLEHARTVHEEHQPIDMMGMMISMADEMPGQARATESSRPGSPSKMKQMMRRMGKGMSPEKALKMAKMMGASDEALAKMKAAMEGEKEAVEAAKAEPATPQMSEEERRDIEMSEAIVEVERTVKNVGRYRELLMTSPEHELDAMVNALNGGFTEPSPGGDPIVNPNVLPTGRNLYGINAENTPSESAWEKGKLLAENTLKMYLNRHNDSLPRKVSYTLWSGEFIETGGATIAQVLYMLGVEPVRDAFGRVTDLRLIPSAELGRPRIDVCVQTSGQLRDLAASRLFLIDRAVRMAAEANDGVQNYVSEGVRESERRLVDGGMSPSEARTVAVYRVFGGVNGGYGTGIQAMVQAGDKWENESEIANVYLNNMGAYYGSQDQWESVRQHAFEAALSNTDAVVQPRQSNTWGALSLDHVYEFMGGMNLAVRNITGKDPDAYISDYRNRNNARMQEVKEAIGVESRTTLFNPNYIREQMKGGATAAGSFAELVQNTYGWNVMKPDAIDNEMWDEIYNVYVKDSYGLGVHRFFEQTNPAALQDITATMMESARKGLWKATEQQLTDIAQLHTELVTKHAASCTPAVCNNAKLRSFIAEHSSTDQASSYNKAIDRARQSSQSAGKDAMRLKKETLNESAETQSHTLSNVLVLAGVLAVLAVAVIMLRRRHRQREEE